MYQSYCETELYLFILTIQLTLLQLECIEAEYYQGLAEVFVRRESLETCSSLGILIFGGTESLTGQPELFSPRTGEQCGLASLPPPHQLLQASGRVFCSSSCLQWTGQAWQALSLPEGRMTHLVWRVQEGFLLLGGKLSTGFTDSSVLVKHDGTFQASFNLNRKLG